MRTSHRLSHAHTHANMHMYYAGKRHGASCVHTHTHNCTHTYTGECHVTLCMYTYAQIRLSIVYVYLCVHAQGDLVFACIHNT